MRQTVLLAGELGAGLGHVVPLFRIAAALRGQADARGIDLRFVFAVHDPSQLHEMKRPGDLALQSPRTPAQGDIKSHTASYAEILIVSGFARLSDLQKGLANWDDLFALVEPSLLIADHSPTAVLAAKGRIPTLVTGNGFSVPPSVIETYPALLADRSAPAVQAQLRDNVNEALKSRGQAPVSRLPLFLKGDARAIFTVRELDPYGALRDTPLAGPYERGLAPTALPAEPKLFLYGHTSVPSFPDLVRAALETGLPICAYLTGNNEEMGFLLRQRGAEIFRTMPDLADLLPRVSLVLSNGGVGLAQASLLAGRPQIVCPIHGESLMTARALEKMGCAIVVMDTGVDTLTETIATAAQNRSLQQACLLAAAKMAPGLPKTALTDVADACLDLLAGGTISGEARAR